MSKMRSTGGAHMRKLAAGTSWAALTLMALALPAAAAQAQGGGTVASEPAVRIDIPAQPLGDALRRFAEQTGIQLGYSTDLVAGKRSAAVGGTLSPREALAQLLSGTGLGASISGNNATIRELAGAGDGETVAGVVNVEGVQGSPYFGGAGQAAGVNGINGSRDITATEGTGNFTSGALTIGSKVPQALKDVPQSISVLTSERLEQQNVTDFTTAMQQLPGVTLAQGASSLQNDFYSRGFAIQNISVDGGASLITGYRDQVSTSFGYYPQIDMSQYDHVELLRGAAGLFNGYGDPGGTINLVRKKPLDHAQYTLEAQAGSWSNYRVVADATAPLAFDGKLRGRLVMTWQDNHYFYDTAKDNRSLIYGIAELDVTPTTLVTAGISYTKQDSVPWDGGMPRYQTGGDLNLPRSTSFVFPWNRWNFETTEIFGSVEQKLGDEWNFKLNLTDNRQHSTRKIGYSQNAVNPANGQGPILGGNYNDYASDQLTAEATLTGALTLFGQRQEITVGVSHANNDGGGNTGYTALIGSSIAHPYQPYPGGPRYCYDYGATDPLYQCPADTIRPALPPINVFDFDPNDPLYSEPANPLPSSRALSQGQIVSGAYVNLRLTAFDKLHLTTGLRWSRYESRTVSEAYCTSLSPICANIGDVFQTDSATYSNTNVSWPPPVSLSFDFTKQLTAYVGYTDIYQDQSRNLTLDLAPIAPLTGSNWEGGLKWAARDGKINLSLAIYRVSQSGFAAEDGYVDYGTGEFVASNGQRFPNYGQIDPLHSCCYKPYADTSNRSQGVDFEATGEVTRGWQVAVSYSYGETTYRGSIYGGDEGKPFLSIAPKHLYKLWTSYDFGAAGASGWLSGLTLSGGVNGQSAGYKSGYLCVNPTLTIDPNTGLAQGCTTYSPPDYVKYQFTVNPYAVFSGRIDYRLSEHWSLAINLENIFDKTYYQTTGSVNGGNWYGTPRSYTATLRGKW